MAKPAGAMCNLACEYCYYLDKQKLYHSPGRSSDMFMSDDLLEMFVRSYIEAQPADSVLFTWHGGEPLLRGLGFYERAIALQQKYAGGRQVDNCIQTNGTLLTDEWCRFFRDNNFLVGVSIDGPREVHDAYRRLRGGGPTFDGVMRGIEKLDRNGVEWNAMAVVNDINVRRPLELYHFFRDTLGCQFLQFAPIVERTGADGLCSPLDADGNLTPYSVHPELWGEFLCTVFDEWWRLDDVGRVFVQLFDATLANWAGVQPGICTLAETCGHALVMEHNGDVYSCDHFVYPAHFLGNLRERPLIAMSLDPRQTAFGATKRDALPHMCRQCEWLRLCHGECPKNRIARTPDGERGLNYLCAGYRRFFAHTAPYFKMLLEEINEK
ncbi:MAG: anaerobic sulfatase-maturation protein [Duncaniella sp.]|nr:anaerobic sulfatase-maturation protein [Duncaniella sp.]